MAKTKSIQESIQASIAVKPSALGVLVVTVLKILTKTKPLPKYEHIIEEKRNEHRLMMERNQEGDDWSLDRLLFEKVLKRIKEKNKKMFYLFNRAGPTYKEAIFLLMKRLIQREEVPRAYDFTTLSQIQL